MINAIDQDINYYNYYEDRQKIADENNQDVPGAETGAGAGLAGIVARRKREKENKINADKQQVSEAKGQKQEVKIEVGTLEREKEKLRQAKMRYGVTNDPDDLRNVIEQQKKVDSYQKQKTQTPQEKKKSEIYRELAEKTGNKIYIKMAEEYAKAEQQQEGVKAKQKVEPQKETEQAKRTLETEKDVEDFRKLVDARLDFKYDKKYGQSQEEMEKINEELAKFEKSDKMNEIINEANMAKLRQLKMRYDVTHDLGVLKDAMELGKKVKTYQDQQKSKEQEKEQTKQKKERSGFDRDDR